MPKRLSKTFEELCRRRVIRFSFFEVDLEERELRKSGMRIKLAEQPFQILAMLLEHPGQIVTREQLQQRLWPQDTFVAFDLSLNAAVKKLRQALGDDSQNPRFIETLYRRGYRFIDAVDGVAQHQRPVIEAAPRLVTKDEPASIAVLPFVNISADQENEYFSDGLAEDIINALAKVAELRVIARTSAFAFRGKEQDLRLIGQRLNVGTILEGSVRRVGNRIRVTAKLIKVSDESHLWSQTYDRELTDIFAIQGCISKAIANALRVKLATPRPRTNVEAFQSYLRGLYWYERYTLRSLAKAKDSFEQSLRHDPTCAPAYAGLAVIYYSLGAKGVEAMTEMGPLAKCAAEKALAIDETLSEAHHVLGLVAGTVEYDWKSAEYHFQAALAVDPVPPLVRCRYSLYFLIPMRRFEEAVAQYQPALETDPLSMMIHFGLALALYCSRQYDDAIEHAARAVDLDPDHWLAHFAMGLALSQKGSLRESITSLEATLRLSPSFTLATGFLAASYVRSGDPSHAEKLMEEVSERSSKQYVSPFCFGIYHAALGQADKTFEFLQAALAKRDPFLTRMDAEPYFDPFRSDPRFRDLLHQMNLG